MTFENLKVGDYVIVSDRIGEHLEQVKKITKTMIITEHQRFNNKTGYKCNCDAWAIVSIRVPTDSEIETIIYKNKVSKIKSLIIPKLNDCFNLEKLEKINSILGEEV